MHMWILKLAVLPGGTVVVTETSDGIPPGEITVRGGDDGNKVILEAGRRDPQGRYVISAHHRRDRAEEAVIGVGAAGEIP